MPRIEMKVEASGNFRDFSTQYPSVEFHILSSRPADNGEIVLMETRIDDSERFLEYLEEDTQVGWLDVLNNDDDVVLVQFLQTPIPAPGKAAEDVKISPPFPLVIRDGWVYSDFVASREVVEEYRRNLEEHGVRHEILSITEPQGPASILTDRQRQFIEAALDGGYYEQPRQCSITDIAESLDVNKSTAGGILHRAESRIINEYFASIGDPD